ncbi:MAG TPA: ABC transporter ATP-binding protein, partial [Acidimicrobiales bacterium]
MAVAPAGVAVELSGVGCRYRGEVDTPEVDALVDVTLTVAPGELVSVVGPSGSGKSTLLHVMGALSVPTTGRVTLGGHRLDRLRPRQLAEVRARTVGFVFQAFNLLAHLTVAQNVAVPAALAGRPAADRQSRVADLLDLVGLTAKTDSRPGGLSGGEQQRVAVARALVNDPQLILADEPTGNLDSRAGAQVVELLQAAHDAGRTVVIATHDLRLASQADRIVHLRDGHLTHETRPRTHHRPVAKLL